MFSRLRDLFRKFVDATSSLLGSRDKLIELAEGFKLDLVGRDVAYEAAEDIVSKLIELIDRREVRDKKQLIRSLREIIYSYFKDAGSIDIIDMARSRKPLKIVFMGINGVGKTTTIAKVAVYLRSRGFRPLMVAADTFRAAAQEQLKKHDAEDIVAVDVVEVNPLYDTSDVTSILAFKIIVEITLEGDIYRRRDIVGRYRYLGV